MREVVKRITTPVFQAFVKRYFRKRRKWRFKDIEIDVSPGVFFPHFTLSTRVLLEFIEPLDLTGKTFLELGCGTGAISVLAAKKGAVVTATDINQEAVDNARHNASLNGVEYVVITSDLFEQIPNQAFGFIAINPPYYPRDPQNMEEKAWYCGEHFEYFEKLFSTLGAYTNGDSQVFMILSEDCDVARIEETASRYGIGISKVLEKKRWGERNFIFQLKE